MLNTIIELKNSTLQKFGPILGWVILVLGGIVALGIIGFLLRVFFKLAITLIIIGAVAFAGYYVYENFIKTKKEP